MDSNQTNERGTRQRPACPPHTAEQQSLRPGHSTRPPERPPSAEPRSRRAAGTVLEGRSSASVSQSQVPSSAPPSVRFSHQSHAQDRALFTPRWCLHLPAHQLQGPVVWEHQGPRDLPGHPKGASRPCCSKAELKGPRERPGEYAQGRVYGGLSPESPGWACTVKES